MSDTRDLAIPEPLSEMLGGAPQHYPSTGPWPPQPMGGPPGWCRPPTSVWPPCPPPMGAWPAGLYRINECWDEVARTKAFLARMMKEIIAEDPSIIAVGQPIVGVTNGTDAAPGMVGEYMRFAQSVSYPAGTSTQIITIGSLPAGDWDVGLYTVSGELWDALNVWLTFPPPPGWSDRLQAVDYTAGSQGTVAFVIGSTVRALTNTATPITMNVLMESTTASTGASLEIVVWARRSR